MAIGDVYEATLGDCADLWYVDAGMYGTAEYGSVYLLDAERPALVDTGLGTNNDRVFDLLDAAGVDPEDLEAIAVTHVHLDHAGGAGFLLESCPNAEVYAHGAAVPHLVDPDRLWEGTKRAVGDQIKYYTEPRPVPEDRVTEVADGDTVDLGDHALEVHHAPGHAPHQVVFRDPANEAVFSADAAGIYAPSREQVFPTSPPPNFDPEQCQEDVDLLRSLDPAVICYTHFGPALAGEKLDRYAEVLGSWVEAVAEARAELDDDEAVIDRLVAAADDEVDAWGREKGEAEVRMNVSGVLTALDRAE